MLLPKLLFFLHILFHLGYTQTRLEQCNVLGQVRLVNGTNEREGRVELCVNRIWGTICDDLWDSRDGQVVCQNLGFSFNGAVAAPRAFFGPGSGPIVLDDLECSGNEISLLACPHQGVGNNNCVHEEDASVVCQPFNFSCNDGEVRLAGGNLEHEGRVEICFDDQFGTICDDEWDRIDAAVICNQLGFSKDDAIAVIRTETFANGIGNIYLDNVRCQGHEENITQCAHNGILRHNCGHHEDAGVICKPMGHYNICGDGELRLAGGRYESEGRLEVCFNDHWGTICDDLWDHRDAGVACRQLGFSIQGAIALSSGAFGPGVGTIFLDSIGCDGTEEFLHQCMNDGLGDHNCIHNEDAAVICRESTQMCLAGSVRLVNGTEGRLYEGRVEVCNTGHWGTVCDQQWDNADATVICNQLGYPGVSLALPKSFYGKGRGLIWYSKLGCSGNETNFIDCPRRQPSERTCNHNTDANVICTAPNHMQPEGYCTNGNVRIVDGSLHNEGRVELCFNGHWGTICSNSWDDTEAAVVCQQLGFEATGSLATLNGFFGSGTGPILLDSVMCIGNESQLLQCLSVQYLSQHNCKKNEVAGVICPVSRGQRSCENGDVRLKGGSSDAEGRVEVCINSRWGTVCRGGIQSWDSNTAEIVCKQLGFNITETRGIATYGISFGIGTGPIFLNNLNCFGSEQNLLECVGSHFDFITDCDHSQDIGVVCSRIPCVENVARLVGSPRKHKNMGRVEICVDGSFRRASSSGFEASQAAAVCKQLGLPGFEVTSATFFGKADGKIYSLTLSESGAINGTIKMEDSSQNNDVGLICTNGRVVDGCSTGDIRLAGGSSTREGRVEVCLGGNWGTICDDSWDNNGAAVACRMLGYTTSGAQAKSFGGNTSIPILLDDLKCNGTESSLLQCQGRNSRGHDCTHKEDAGVKCSSGNKRPSHWNLTALVVTMSVLLFLILITAVAIIILITYTKARMKLLDMKNTITYKESQLQCKKEKTASVPSHEAKL